MAEKVHLINLRGRVIQIDKSEMNSYVEKGFTYILDPKQTYYPQFDQSANKTPLTATIKEKTMGIPKPRYSFEYIEIE